MNFSYWENKHLVQPSDISIIGAGITGLTSAVFLKRKYPQKKIRILERGVTPWGASTKNAGFACFGSISEILSDLKSTSKEETVRLVEKRWQGLSELRSLLGDGNIDFQRNGGYELFTQQQSCLEQECLDSIPLLNELLKPVIGSSIFEVCNKQFGFSKVSSLIKNNYEGQIDTGLMMKNLIRLANDEGVEILYGASLVDYNRDKAKLTLILEGGMQLHTEQLVICTNGFSNSLINNDVQPARAQVLITKPIDDLKIKGTFHLEEGFYYFRNIDNRILFGGGRNLDFQGETTTDMENSELILTELKRYLKQVILPNQSFEIDSTWAGIMGTGKTKSPIIEKIDENVYIGVRLGGMGVAIGTLVGKEISEIIEI